VATSTPLAPIPPVPESAKDDSKDFVEHLRSIQFSLMASCLTLIVIVQFPAPKAVQRASEQLRSITDIVQQWDDHWLSLAVEDTSKNQFGAGMCIQPLTSFSATVDGKELSIVFDDRNWGVLDGPSQSEPILYDQLGSTTSLSIPHNVKQFGQIWDADIKLVCPLSISDDAALVSATQTGIKKTKVSLKHAQRSTNNDAEKVVMILEPVYTAITLWDELDINSAKGDAGSQHFFYSGAISDNLSLLVPVISSTSFDLHFRQFLLKREFGRQLHDSLFDANFHDLTESTKDFADIDFGHMQAILAHNMQNTRETFEAFGVKFPIETASQWGILVILAIQLYFSVHMAEYRKRGFKMSTVAWIGTYSGAVPKALFIITGLITPFVVVFYLGFSKTELPIPAVTFAFVISCFLAWKSKLPKHHAPSDAPSKKRFSLRGLGFRMFLKKD